EPARHLADVAGRDPTDAAPEERLDRLHLVGVGAARRRHPRRPALLGGEGRCARPGPRDGARARTRPGPRQLDHPRTDPDRHPEGQAQRREEGGDRRDDPARPPRRHRRRRGRVPVPRQRPVQLLHRHHARRERRHVDSLNPTTIRRQTMQRKTFVHTLFALAAIAATCGAQAQTTKLTLGHGAAPGNPRNEAAVLFAERVKAKTNGRIEIQVAHSAQLGDDAAMITALRSGTLDMSANSQGAIANVVPEYSAIGLPFLFSDVQKAWQLLDGPVGEELSKRTAAKGMVVLGYWDNGIRHVTNSKRAIKAPTDLKGLKIRTPPDGMTV